MMQIFQFTDFLKPPHWFDSPQVFYFMTNVSLIFGECWDGWNVDVAINKGEGAVLQSKFDMQGQSYLCDGEGGAGVLLAVAGFLMRE